MLHACRYFLLTTVVLLATSNPASGYWNYPNVKDEVYEQPVSFMAAKNPHDKLGNVIKAAAVPCNMREACTCGGTAAYMESIHQQYAQEQNVGGVHTRPAVDSWAPYDFSKFEDYLNAHHDDSAEHNRVRRSPKRRRGRVGRRRGRQRASTANAYELVNTTSAQVPIARRRGEDDTDTLQGRRKKKHKTEKKNNYESYDPPVKDREAGYVEMPKDLYQAHLRPGVIFRIHMSEAILKMQYRNYGEDKDESVIEADVEYLRLTRKVINDEITKFEDLKWLVSWFNNRSELVQEHSCNTRYFAVGIPPTMFTHSEEYMKRMCLFHNVYIDHVPYVVGEDGSLMAAVAPPVLHCDAATCTSVPFIDSVMFDERLSRTNVRTVTRCQASCRAHCRNDADCLKRCTDRCFRAD